ncbi:hypothetical protein SAMN05428997_1469 [Bosea sp. CRIB-10]|uniref:hypothetical protein n=1 Tax=Bosea sp. CRIB-10 TaxID=378404 RepID=UPI0008DF8FDE|nr:hypothetical protein [Bosea sp. CRIB-10]SFD72559.1 hypothetical protein SAMN05428997_1469 [Bosea sp. CRIB-10]
MVSAARLPDDARAIAWRTMRVLSAEYGQFTVATIAALAPAAYPPIAEWVQWLHRERVLDIVGSGTYGPTYAVQVQGDAPPLGRMTNGRGAQQQRQIWAAMRKMRSWKPDGLADAASTEECEVTAHAVRTYSRSLQKAGLVEDRGGLWRLKPSADTGPRAPVVGTAFVFDLNSGKTVNVTDPETPRRAA